MGLGVKREHLFDALRAKGIAFVAIPDKKYTYKLFGNDELWVEYIPPELGRRTPQHLADLFGFPVEWLYNPLLIPRENDDNKPN